MASVPQKSLCPPIIGYSYIHLASIPVPSDFKPEKKSSWGLSSIIPNMVLLWLAKERACAKYRIRAKYKRNMNGRPQLTKYEEEERRESKQNSIQTQATAAYNVVSRLLSSQHLFPPRFHRSKLQYSWRNKKKQKEKRKKKNPGVKAPFEGKRSFYEDCLFVFA